MNIIVCLECDKSADSGKFVEFLLTAIYDALCEIVNTEQVNEQVTIPEKLNRFGAVWGVGYKLEVI